MASVKPVIVREVWADNADYEFFLIRLIINKFCFASMDTEFPGVIYQPPLLNNGKLAPLSPQQAYHFMKKNVNDTKMIQLGLTLSDHAGNLPDFGSNFSYVWEFNFCDFDINDKVHQNEGSIELLKKQGVDFKKNRERGVDSKHFVRLFQYSGLMCNDYYPTATGFGYNGKVTWITFHSSYDFGHLLKILKQRDLPDNLVVFKEDLNMYFGDSLYDMKEMAKYCDGLYGGLEKIAKSLGVVRMTGKSHQAGSDSLLIMQTFMKLKEKYLSCKRLDVFRCKLFGLDII